jgi:hypothetical protein
MPPLLTLTQSRPGTVATAARGPFGQLELGELVAHEDRIYFVLGFDPIGVPAQRVYLEDIESHLPRTAALTELTPPVRTTQVAA